MPEEHTPSPAPHRAMRFAGCAIVLALLCLLLGTAAVLLPAYLRHEARKNLSPAEREEMRRFVSEPQDFPPEWTAPKPFSPELMQAVEALNRAAAPPNPELVELTFGPWGTAFWSHRADQSGWTSASAILASSRPLLEQAKHLVYAPGYELGLFDSLEATGNQAISFHALRMLLCLDLSQRVRTQQWDAALSASVTTLHFHKRHPVCSLVLHTSALQSLQLTLDCATSAAAATTNSALLASLLHEMNRLDAQLHPEIADKLSLIASLSLLRVARREGYPLEAPPGKAAAYYARLNDNLYEKLTRWSIEHCSPGDARREILQNRMNHPAVRPRWSERFKSWKAFLAPEILYRSSATMQLPHEKIVRVRYDLLRLYLAGRLAELSGQEISPSRPALIPRYLPEMPRDPFTGAPYLWDETCKRFYSVGPDKTDDCAQRAFDWQSGRGDIYLAPAGR